MELRFSSTGPMRSSRASPPTLSGRRWTCRTSSRAEGCAVLPGAHGAVREERRIDDGHEGRRDVGGERFEGHPVRALARLGLLAQQPPRICRSSDQAKPATPPSTKKPTARTSSRLITPEDRPVRVPVPDQAPASARRPAPQLLPRRHPRDPVPACILGRSSAAVCGRPRASAPRVRDEGNYYSPRYSPRGEARVTPPCPPGRLLHLRRRLRGADALVTLHAAEVCRPSAHRGVSREMKSNLLPSRFRPQQGSRAARPGRVPQRTRHAASAPRGTRSRSGGGDDRVTVRLAESFGFCYGVDRAVDYAYQTRVQFPDRRIFLVGEIIHNPHVNSRLREMGVTFLYPAEEGEAKGRFDFSGRRARGRRHPPRLRRHAGGFRAPARRSAAPSWTPPAAACSTSGSAWSSTRATASPRSSTASTTTRRRRPRPARSSSTRAARTSSSTTWTRPGW